MRENKKKWVKIKKNEKKPREMRKNKEKWEKTK